MNAIDVKVLSIFAKGFYIDEYVHEATINAPDGSWNFLKNIKDSDKWIKLIYPLFLQRVIEGMNLAINKDCDLEGWINQTDEYIDVVYDYSQQTKTFYFSNYADIDKCKEDAIMFALENIFIQIKEDW